MTNIKAGCTKKNWGYNLIEIMVVIAIITIISVMVYPSYLEYVFASQRIEAINGLIDLQNRVEANYNKYNNYLPSVANLGLTALPYTTPSGNYSINFLGNASVSYKLTALNLGTGLVKDTQCWTFMIWSHVNASGNTYAKERVALDSTGSIDTTSKCWGLK